jgi:hypothetical protein
MTLYRRVSRHCKLKIIIIRSSSYITHNRYIKYKIHNMNRIYIKIIKWIYIVTKIQNKTIKYKHYNHKKMNTNMHLIIKTSKNPTTLKIKSYL